MDDPASHIICSNGYSSPEDITNILKNISKTPTPFQARELKILSGVLAKIQRRKNTTKK
jgi:hypothetical protein